MFQEALREVVEGAEGSTAALLMGYDGIAVDQYSRGASTISVDAVGAEFSVILREVQKAARLLNAGETHEVAIRTEQMTTVVRLLNEDYFIAVTLRPEGNLGKARYLLRIQGPRILGALE